MEFFGTVAAAITTALLLSATANLWLTVRTSGRPAEEVDPSERRRKRIRDLRRSLRESTRLLAELEEDVTTGQARAEQLRDQIQRDEELAKLTHEQAQAMRSLVAEQLGASSRRAFWQQVAIGAVFFLLGSGFTMLVS
jgi:hypothetical protein